MKLKDTYTRRIHLFLSLVLFIFSISSVSLSDSYGTIWGSIEEKNHRPLERVNIFIRNKTKDFEKKITSDLSGAFRFPGIPIGQYFIRIEANGYQALHIENIFIEPSCTIYLEVILNQKENKEPSSSSVFRVDFPNRANQTSLNETQIHNSPTAHNVWSLVENQDLSATTNRIDVGGLWGTTPALFSARGGSSWTQSIYLLNGMEVTNPYNTGSPLFFPDFYSLHYSNLYNSSLPPEALSPGGFLNIITREGTDQFHGSISSFLIHKILQSSNISPALIKEGITDSHSFNYLTDGNINLSGPIIPGKLTFFTSLTNFQLSQDLAEYEKENKSSVLSGLLSLRYRYLNGSLLFLWTGQTISHPSFGAERQIPFSSTIDLKEKYHVFQAIWDSRIRDRHFFKAGFSFSQGDMNSDAQTGSSGQHGIDIFKGIPSGAVPFTGQNQRDSLTFLLKGESLAENFLKAKHKFQYGFQLQRSFASSQKTIQDNLHLRFFDNTPVEVVKYNTPVHHQEAALHLNFFVQDTLVFSNLLSIYFGMHIVSSKGWIPDLVSSFEKNEIRWLHISPRLGITFPLSRSKTSALKISAARYYFTLPLSYLTYGNP
ncbi:carboxypeptidase regulatory-like domain-containing protein, partial [Acidobacteriota bacterium]